MCMISFLFPARPKKSRQHKSKRPRHRRAERSQADKALPQQNDDLKAPSFFAEDTLARLRISFGQYSLRQQTTGARNHERFERSTRDSTRPEKGRGRPDEALRSSLENEGRCQPTSIEPQFQTGVANSPGCRDRNSVGCACFCCCCCCCCSRGGCGTASTLAIPELEDDRARSHQRRPNHSHVIHPTEIRRHRKQATGRALKP